MEFFCKVVLVFLVAAERLTAGTRKQIALQKMKS
jgi:hypothetical protein